MSSERTYKDKAGKERMINERQRRFCEIYVYGVTGEDGRITHPPLADCYTLAGYDTGGYARVNLTAKAGKLLAQPHIQEYIDYLRQELENRERKKALWDREQMLLELRELFLDAKAASSVKVLDSEGNLVPAKYDSRAASVAVKTAGQVAQMLGYNEPEKSETTIKVDFGEKEVSRWAK